MHEMLRLLKAAPHARKQKGKSLHFVIVGILFGRIARRGKDPADFASGFGFLDAGAGEVEPPIVAVVEAEEHFLSRLENVRDSCLLHARVDVVRVTCIGKEGVFLLAVVGIVEVVVESERVVEVEPERVDEKFR